MFGRRDSAGPDIATAVPAVAARTETANNMLPMVSVIVAAHNEEAAIAAKIRNSGFGLSARAFGIADWKRRVFGSH